MKVKLLISIIIISLSMPGHSQLFQQHFQSSMRHFHEVFNLQLPGSNGDLVVAGNSFNGSLQEPFIEVLRINETAGNPVWRTVLHDPGAVYEDLRAFDMTHYLSGNDPVIAFTGSVSIADTNYAFIARIDGNGLFTDAAYYHDIVPGAIHSQGLSIIYSQQGFVVGGYASMDYDHGTNDPKHGFVMKVDDNLVPVWTKVIHTNYPNASSDYDMVSDVLETADGYFVSGSVTSMPLFTQQAVMALKYDFNGNLLWDNSYYVGNSRDVGVDSWYDIVADEIYLLANYSVSHYFGVSVFDNATGVIDPSRSWRAFDWDYLDRYGFTIMESKQDSNLVVAGYMRDGTYTDESGNMVYAQSLPFTYEFNKSSGALAGVNYYYHVPYTEPGFSDYFDFWFFQMPLIYYPAMALKLNNNEGYFISGYRTDSIGGYTETELIKTDSMHRNSCGLSPLILQHEQVQPNYVPADTFSTTPGHQLFVLTNMPYEYILTETCPVASSCSCDSLAKDVAEGFAYVTTGLSIDLKPLSLDDECDSVYWDFGDGHTAVSQGNQQVSHTYAGADSYLVCMTVTRYESAADQCTDSICTLIDISSGVGIGEAQEDGIRIYPNPARDKFFVEADDPAYLAAYRLYNSMGVEVMSGRPASVPLLVDISSLKAGIYFLRVEYSDRMFVRKVFIE
jgi:hypothetical protein